MLPALAWKDIQLSESLSITNIENKNGIKYVSVKISNIDNILPPVKQQKVGYEIDKFGIKCSTKEAGLLSISTYNTNNTIISEYNKISDLIYWTKIKNDDFKHTLYQNVCK